MSPNISSPPSSDKKTRPGVDLFARAENRAHDEWLADLLGADDDHQAPDEQHERHRVMPEDPQEAHCRRPDEHRPDHRNERSDERKHAEEDWMRHARDEKPRCRRHGLEESGQRRAEDRRARDAAKLAEQVARLARLQRRDAFEPAAEPRPFEQEEVERDEHDGRCEIPPPTSPRRDVARDGRPSRRRADRAPRAARATDATAAARAPSAARRARRACRAVAPRSC